MQAPLEFFQRRLIFVCGKGGVGKTSVSQALALSLARDRSRKILWATFEDPSLPRHTPVQKATNLFHISCGAHESFEEYATLKIHSALLAKIFLQNKLVRYLSQAAPGIPDLTMLGKVWHERAHFDHVVVDMPATGHGIAMFQSTINFNRLFKTGPLHKDMGEMILTLDDPSVSGMLVVGIPEEMPLRESLELGQTLESLFKHNPARYLLNRHFGAALPDSSRPDTSGISPHPDEWPSPFAADLEDYAAKRLLLEAENLRLWTQPYWKLPLLSPVDHIVPTLAAKLTEIMETQDADR